MNTEWFCWIVSSNLLICPSEESASMRCNGGTIEVQSVGVLGGMTLTQDRRLTTETSQFLPSVTNVWVNIFVDFRRTLELHLYHKRVSRAVLDI